MNKQLFTAAFCALLESTPLSMVQATSLTNQQLTSQEFSQLAQIGSKTASDLQIKSKSEAHLEAVKPKPKQKKPKKPHGGKSQGSSSSFVDPCAGFTISLVPGNLPFGEWWIGGADYYVLQRTFVVPIMATVGDDLTNPILVGQYLLVDQFEALKFVLDNSSFIATDSFIQLFDAVLPVDAAGMQTLYTNRRNQLGDAAFGDLLTQYFTAIYFSEDSVLPIVFQRSIRTCTNTWSVKSLNYATIADDPSITVPNTSQGYFRFYTSNYDFLGTKIPYSVCAIAASSQTCQDFSFFLD